MLWVLIGLVTLACCAVLYASSRRAATESEAPTSLDANEQFYRDQLAGLERDKAMGRLDDAQAAAAEAELAREYVRQSKETRSDSASRWGSRAILVIIPLVALGGFGLYALIGQAGLPAQPLAQREAVALQQGGDQERSLDAAVAEVEAQLERDPDDVRGWQVLGPVYMNRQDFESAVRAYRRVLDLAPPTAEAETDLAEALIMRADGAATPEAMDLLRSAADRDPQHVRSRFYLAGELTRQGSFDAAVPIWTRLLDIATGQEPWIETARSGLAAAQAGAQPGAQGGGDAASDAMIADMVARLATRLYDEGGTAQEWQRLVQSRLVLGDRETARSDLSAGLAALEGEGRESLRAFAAERDLALEEQD